MCVCMAWGGGRVKACTNTHAANPPTTFPLPWVHRATLRAGPAQAHAHLMRPRLKARRLRRMAGVWGKEPMVVVGSAGYCTWLDLQGGRGQVQQGASQWACSAGSAAGHAQGRKCMQARTGSPSAERRHGQARQALLRQSSNPPLTARLEAQPMRAARYAGEAWGRVRPPCTTASALPQSQPRAHLRCSYGCGRLNMPASSCAALVGGAPVKAERSSSEAAPGAAAPSAWAAPTTCTERRVAGSPGIQSPALRASPGRAAVHQAVRRRVCAAPSWRRPALVAACSRPCNPPSGAGAQRPEACAECRAQGRPAPHTSPARHPYRTNSHPYKGGTLPAGTHLAQLLQCKGQGARRRLRQRASRLGRQVVGHVLQGGGGLQGAGGAGAAGRIAPCWRRAGCEARPSQGLSQSA